MPSPPTPEDKTDSHSNQGRRTDLTLSKEQLNLNNINDHSKDSTPPLASPSEYNSSGTSSFNHSIQLGGDGGDSALSQNNRGEFQQKQWEKQAWVRNGSIDQNGRFSFASGGGAAWRGEGKREELEVDCRKQHCSRLTLVSSIDFGLFTLVVSLSNLSQKVL